MSRCTIIVPLLCASLYYCLREVNARVLGKGLELLSVNDGKFEINELLFADDTALVADSEQKLCRLVAELGRICEKEKS